jgi:hypothetical protein
MTARKAAVLRKRSRMLIAVAVAAVVAAVAAGCGSVGRVLGSSPGTGPSAGRGAGSSPQVSAGLPPCPVTVGSTIPPAGVDYTVRVPARFGWLPSDLVNEVDQGPSNGTLMPDTYNARAYANWIALQPYIGLTVYPDADLVPGQHQPVVRCTPPPNLPVEPSSRARWPSASPTRAPSEVQTSAPPVNGAPAYWLTGSRGSQVQLVWKTKSGTWLALGADNTPGDVQEILEHVAATLTVGDVPLPQPVQVKGIPAAAQMRPGGISDNLILPGHPGVPSIPIVIISLYFGPVSHEAMALIYVTPAGHKVNTMAGGSPCKTANHLSVCVEARTASGVLVTKYVPGGAAALLAHVVSFGPDQANWSPDLIVGTS